MKYLFIGLIQLYRITLSKILPPSCRYTPSCSQYAIIAIGRFGAVKGGCLAFLRILRCHPFAAGGYDPVPEKVSKNSWQNLEKAELSEIGEII